MEEIKREIEIGTDYFEVWISAQVDYVNLFFRGDGYQIYDIKWNKLVYSDYANELIENYIESNLENIKEEFIKTCERKCQPLEP
jgi:hypothetical protein